LVVLFPVDGTEGIVVDVVVVVGGGCERETEIGGAIVVNDGVGAITDVSKLPLGFWVKGTGGCNAADEINGLIGGVIGLAAGILFK
jgi:hypothetical protein